MWPSFGRQDGNCRQAGVLSRAATSTCTQLPADPFLRAHLFLGLSLLCCALLPSHPINKCTQGFCFPGALASRADALQQRFVSTDCVQLLYLEFLVYRGPSWFTGDPPDGCMSPVVADRCSGVGKDCPYRTAAPCWVPVGTAEGLRESEGCGVGGEQRCCQTRSHTSECSG